MYPGFAKTARDEGFEEIAEWLETLARAEKSHAGRFRRASRTSADATRPTECDGDGPGAPARGRSRVHDSRSATCGS